MVRIITIFFIVASASLTYARYLKVFNCTTSELTSSRQNAIIQAQKCFMDLEKEGVSMYIPENPTDKDAFAGRIEKVCQKSTNLKECYVAFITNLGNCFDERSQKDLDFILTMVKRSVDYACLGNGTDFSSFVAGGGYKCYADNVDSILKCARADVLNNLLSRVRFSDDAEGVEYSPPISCDKFGEVEVCATGRLKSCKLADSVYIMSLFKYATQC